MMSKEPNFFPEDAFYWEAARNGTLMLRECKACQKLHFYPRGHCPHCGSLEVNWRAASGRGRIYSYTVADIKGRESVMPSIIELEEGIRITSVITGSTPESLYIGKEVHAHFVACKNQTSLLHFRTPESLQAELMINQWITERKQLLSAELSVQSLPHIQQVAVIGAGNMGSAIALAMVLQNLPTVLVDSDVTKLEQAKALIIRKTKEIAEKKNDVTLLERSALLETSVEMGSIAKADFVIESVWEDKKTKQQVLQSIEEYVADHCPIGTNTSTFDINDLASVMRAPERLVGLHFFNPAHVIALIEIIQGNLTNTYTVFQAKQMCQMLGKVPVDVGNCHGFAANRMMIGREKQARQLLIEGATPHQVDHVLRKFGLPMGPFELQDMTGGIEVNYRRRQASGEKDPVIDALFEMGRLGKKSGAGFYTYRDGKAVSKMDESLQQLLEKLAKSQNIERQKFSDAVILQRLMEPVLHEGKALLAEGMVQSAKDIDLIWSLGFGWPKHKVGPIYWSEHLMNDTHALQTPPM